MADDDPWDWWRAKLAGEDTSQSESTPHAGFFRWVRKDHYGAKKYATPVVYWPDGRGGLNCRFDGKDAAPQYGADKWIQVCQNPVPEDWYRAVAEKDPPDPTWKDGLPLTSGGMGDNLPPPDDALFFEAIKDKIEPLAKQAAARLEGEAITEATEASKVGTLADELSELWKQADAARKAERKPHDEALKAIQTKWAPLLLLAETYVNLKYKLLTPWLKKLEEQRKAEITEAAITGAPIPESRKKRPQVTTRGRAMSLKPVKTAEITDYAACLAFFAESPDVKEVVQTLANKAVRAGITVPGTKVTEESKAV